jgi:phenylacetic acid degradation protein
LVEDNGHIGHGAILHSCIIRRGALVGMNSVVMDDAEIGEEAFVAGNSFVLAGMKVGPRTLVAGTPATVKRILGVREIAWKQGATESYQHLTRRCLATMREVSPLTALDADRPSLATPDVRPLLETPRG